MEPIDSTLTVSPAAVNCPICSFSIISTAPFCSHCGFPLNGTFEEKDKFDLDYKIKRAELEGAKEVAQQGTKTLYWLAGLIFGSNLIFYAINKQSVYLITGVLIPVIFLLLAQWSKKKPFTALVTALVFFATIIIADALDDPLTIFRGIIVKFIVIFYLAKGIKSARNAQQIQEELAQLNWNQ